MATTFQTIASSPIGPFEFQPVIAGTTYNAKFPYNAADNRLYLDLEDLAGNSILYCALAETGPSQQVTLTWALGVATVTTPAPHNVPIGQPALARISQTNSGFDGFPLQMLATTATALTFQLPDDPQVEPIPGVLSFDNNLIEGVIPGGLLVYHDDLNQVEYQ